MLFSSVYQPSIQPCTAEGFSRLYGLYYKTGTAYSAPNIFHTEIIDGKESSAPFIELGRGLATLPTMHSGAGEGGDQVTTVFTQLSTSTIFRQQSKTVIPIRSGKRSWQDLAVQ